MATPKKTKAKKGEVASQKITYHYQKTTSYRSIYVDGAHGGLTNKGHLQMSFYLERHPIPKTQDFSISKGVTTLIKQDSKKGVIRELECSLLMDYNTMRSVHEWMGQKIEEFNILFKIKKDVI